MRPFKFFIPLALFAFLFFIPNPLTDLLVSGFLRAQLGRPVSLRGVRYDFPCRISFSEARLKPSDTTGEIHVRGGRVDYLREKRRTAFRAKEIDLGPLWLEKDSTTARFVQSHDLEKGLVLKNSIWTLVRKDGVLYVRLLSAEAGGASLRGGLRFEEGCVSKWATALWLPKQLWGRFPDLVEKKFTQDAEGRRLFKLTWSRDSWRLWGRFGPVLEARWQ